MNVQTEEATGIISYFNGAFSSIYFLDVFSSLNKSVLYGFTIGMFGYYKYFNAT